jgi:sortase A
VPVKILGALGKVLVSAGVLVLLFAAYQVWGTNIQTDQAQRELDREFDELVRQRAANAENSTTTSTTEAPTIGSETTVPPVTTPAEPAPDIVAPATGELVGRISIPDIGLKNFKFVQGTATEQLKRGAAHYTATPLPGQRGNAAIAGHRTTYGAPFSNLDKIAVGDEIVVETIQGTFTYKAIGTRIVAPSEVSVLESDGRNLLTLTACHPRYDLRQRIVVQAELQGDVVPELAGQEEATTTPDRGDGDAIDLDGDSGTLGAADIPWVQLALWGTATAAVWFLAWVLARRVLGERRRALRWSPYVVGLAPFIFCLYFFYENLSAAMPASY